MVMLGSRHKTQSPAIPQRHLELAGALAHAACDMHSRGVRGGMAADSVVVVREIDESPSDFRIALLIDIADALGRMALRMYGAAREEAMEYLETAHPSAAVALAAISRRGAVAMIVSTRDDRISVFALTP